MEAKKQVFRASLLLMSICCLTLIPFIIFRERRVATRNYCSFKFFDLNNDPFSGIMLSPGKVTIILFADPGCDLCSAEVQDIISARGQIPGVEVIVVVAGSLEQARNFSRNYPMQKTPLFRFVYDRDQVFTACFGRHSVPSLFILDENHQLAKCFQGETSIRSVMMAVNNITH